MTGVVTKVSRAKEKKIIAALLAVDKKKVAAITGVEPEVLDRLLKIPAFRRKLHSAKVTAGDQVIARSDLAFDSAFLAHLRIMLDPYTPPMVRLKAIKLFYDLEEKVILQHIWAELSELQESAKRQHAR